MALAAASTTLGDASEVRDIRFERMLLLDEQTPVTAVASVEAPGVVTFEVQTNHEGDYERRAVALLHAAEDDSATRAGHPQPARGAPEPRDGVTAAAVRRTWCPVRSGETGLVAAHTGDG
jgi:mycocerosic acid synthase